MFVGEGEGTEAAAAVAAAAAAAGDTASFVLLATADLRRLACFAFFFPLAIIWLGEREREREQC